jgi:predicted DNA-binding transcriptional regulator YafY
VPHASRKYSAFLVIPQVERRHRLIEELRATAPRRISGSSLAGRLGVSVRTIERDLAELVDAGVPICVQRGPGGGYLLEMGGPPVAITFSAGEVAALVASLVAVGPYSSATALSALDKLLDAVRSGRTAAAP